MTSPKLFIFLGATIGGILFGWIGSLIDHSALGGWSLFLSTVGGLVGIYAGYWVSKHVY